MLGGLWRKLGKAAPATETLQVIQAEVVTPPPTEAVEAAPAPIQAADLTAPYAGARVTKLNSHWKPRHYSGDEAVKQSWDLLTSRIRDRVRNDSIFQKVKSQMSRLVIGTGIDAYSDASELDEENEQLVKYEIESDTWFERWALEEADVTGEHTYFDLQRVAFEDEMESGNCLWLECLDDNPKRTLPLCYQLIEFEQIDQNQDRDAGYLRKNGQRYNRISNGIEYDAAGRKVAYYLFEAHPYDSSSGWSNEPVRIPAERILHQYLWTRPSGRVGISWFSAPMQTNFDLDRYVANELTTRGLMALMGIVVKGDQYPDIGLDAEDPETGLPGFKMGYPQISRIKSSEEVDVVETNRNAGDATALINLLLNLQAMGCRLSVNRLLGDPSKANLASIKASHQDDDAMVAPIVESIANKVIRHIRTRHTEVAIARGLIRSISAREFRDRRWQYTTWECIGSNRSDLDKDDGEASIDRLRSGLSTYQGECARRGHHWRRNLRRMATVNKAARAAGVILDWTKGNGGQLAGSSSDAQALKEANQAEQGSGNGQNSSDE